ncbi:SE1561 family protein [Halalkalibacterium ligniniphilum]|uniref:SE1561 family protein n=1 Tax=Halalkalibacterium ligniniphilum TaxID=1134413 RepID=UPI00034C8CC3|nr:SE1561 family protein [Halalkalibacterium ligniniphilum]
MGGANHNKKDQLTYLQNRFNSVLTMLESIDPDEAGVEEIDRLLTLLDDIETKCKQFRYDWSE